MMTAIALLDALNGPADPTGPRDARALDSLSQLTAQLIESALADLDRLRRYERQFVFLPQADPSRQPELRHSVWQLYSEWAADAGRLRSRAVALIEAGVTVAAFEELELAIGRTNAMLSVLPEKTIQGIRDALEGHGTPAKELRDELHARLRA